MGVRWAMLAAVVAVLVAGCGGGSAVPGTRTTAVARHAAHRATRAVHAQPRRPRIDLHADPAVIAARAHVPILCWHQIRDWTASDSAVDRPYIMPPRTFRAEIAHLAAHGWHTVTPDQLVAYLTTGARLPRRPVLLTFDDADEQQYTVALPELRRHGFTATFFVMTVVLDKPNYFTTAQVRRLDRDGMTIAAHTWDHHRVDEYHGSDWRIQITQPKRELERIVGHPVRYFAYPYGVWSPAAFPHLRAAGFRAAFQLEDRPVDRRAPLYTLHRKIADPYLSTAGFDRELRGGF